MDRPFPRPAGGIRVPPLRDEELLSTWLVRVAHGNGLDPWRFGNLVWPGVEIWARDIDRSAHADWLRAVAGRLRVPERRVRDATLLDLQSALDANRPGTLPTVLAAGIHHRTRRRHGLQYCPDCILETPHVYLRAWRLAMAVMCERHGRILRDGCPRCDAPLAPHRNRWLNRDRCAACGADLACERDGPVACMPDRVTRLERGLLPGLLAASADVVATALDLRALLGVLASSVPTERLSHALGLTVGPRIRNAGVFERRRLPGRVEMLDLVAAWTEDWPVSFRAGAAAMRLTQCSFSGRRMGPDLAAEVSRLPARLRPPRVARPPAIHSDDMRRLSRNAPRAYRAARAARLGRLSMP